MVEPDRSEIEEEDMDKLQLSSDSIDMIPPRKRLRVEASEDETDLPVKKRQGSFDERSRVNTVRTDDAETVSDKTNTDDEYSTMKEEGSAFDIVCPENEQTARKETADQDRETKEKQDGTHSPLTETNGGLNTSGGEVKNERVENEESPRKEPATTASVRFTLGNKKAATAGEDSTEVVEKETEETIDGKEENEDDDDDDDDDGDGEEAGTRKQRPARRRRVDTEVVDGLELSVECASDKDESSSESEDEKDVKPRPKTIIVKAEPNESELDCSSDGEKSDDSQQALVDTLQVESERNKTRRRGSRTSFSKLKVSGSEDSQNSNSDEDYSPRTKKRMKKSALTATRRLTTTNKHRSVESKRGGGGGGGRRGRGRANKDTRGPSYKKNAEYISDRDEDADATVVERAAKTTKTKNGMEEEEKEEEEEEFAEKESSSKDERDNNSEKEETSTKGGRRRRRNNAKHTQDRHIQALKKYLSVAGVKVKSYNDIWADCKSNAAKIKRLKELLEKNGVSGRPTLEKCKRVREENEKMKEVSELDTSNIISEGRIARARRTMESVKKLPPNTPPRHREARNTFRRIQTVVDSDSE